MKTKQANKLLVLIISLMMIATLLVGMSITASAEDTGATTDYTSPAANEAKIYGANVNLGGDISMKYYVELGDGVTIDSIKLRTVFLGVEKLLTAAENPVVKDNRTLYVFTLDSITPQCMGDPIDAQLIYNGAALTCEDSSLNDYSVKQNLVNIYDKTGTDENMKQLIIDTLEYGAAAQTYRGYKTDALVTTGLSDAMTAHLNDAVKNADATIPPSSPDVSGTDGSIVKASVHFSTVNYIIIQYPVGDTTGRVSSTAIAAYDFAKKMQFSVEGLFSLGYSINDYCYDACSDTATSAEMKALAQALYNYGLSAHIVEGNHEGGTATCSKQAVCTICGQSYGEKLKHVYQYEAWGSGSIIETCANGCDHSEKLNITIPYGDEAVYTGNQIPIKVDTTGFNASYTLTYDTHDLAAPTNVDSWNFTLTVKDVTITGSYEITAVTPTVTAPTANTLAYTGEAQALVSAGSADFGTMMYRLSADGEFTTTIPTATNAGKYTVYYYAMGDGTNINDSSVESMEVTIAKATPTATAPTGLTATYGDTLANVALTTATGDTSGAWSWKDGNTTSVGNAGTKTFKATFTPTDVTNYKTVEVDLTITVAKKTLTVTPDAKAKTYGDADPDLTYTPVGLIGEDKLTGALSREAGEDVGEYAIKQGTLSAGDNYEIVVDDVIFEITQKDASTNATVTLGEYNSVYDGNYKTPAVTVTLDGKELVKDQDYTVTYEDNLYVGEATVKITFINNYSGEKTATFEITKIEGTDAFDGIWVTIPKKTEG